MMTMTMMKGTKNVVPKGKSREQKSELGRQSNGSKTISGIMVNSLTAIGAHQLLDKLLW